MPKIVDHETRRAEVARAAERTIARRGLRDTTLRDIAREAGHSIGVLTHYFPDKEALLRLALESTIERFVERMAAEVAAMGDATAPDMLRVTIEQSLPIDEERRRQWEVWFAFYGEAVGHEHLQELQRTRYQEFHSLLVTLLRTAQETGHVARALDVEHEADRLVTLVDGIALEAIFNPDHWPPERQLQFVTEHLSAMERPGAGGRGGGAAGRSGRPRSSRRS